MKIGEPGFPVAAAECGRRVLVKVGASFEVGDHDFTKFSMIPSVVLQNQIPEDVACSWYYGKVFVTLKVHLSLLPQCITWQSCTLFWIANTVTKKHYFYKYTDEGPDHRVTYLSVQVSLIALFLKLDLDFLCAARTAPCHSWRSGMNHVHPHCPSSTKKTKRRKTLPFPS